MKEISELKTKRSSKGTSYKAQVETLKGELQKEKAKGADFYFSGEEIDILKEMCFVAEGQYTEVENSGVVTSDFKSRRIELIQRIYRKLHFEE